MYVHVMYATSQRNPTFMDIDQSHDPAPERGTVFPCAHCEWEGCLPLLCAREWVAEAVALDREVRAPAILTLS